MQMKLERCLMIGTLLKQVEFRQAQRMIGLTAYAQGHCVVDFVCPYDSWRDDYDVKIWMNTIKEGRFEDTNKMFEKPTKIDYEIKDYNYEEIINEIQNKL
jgi:adenylylsulfate kinase